MYNSDRAITDLQNDLLGRASFSKHLGRAIYEYLGNDGLVIGLFGKWGTGKTSVINMTLQEISTLSKNDDNKLLVVKFAPWNYSDRENLISLFFQCLKNKVENDKSGKLKKKIGKALNDYAGAFDAVALVPMFGSGLAAILKTTAATEGKKLIQGPSLDESKELLEKALLESSQKIVVVIDDIDRLSNSQIRDVFQLVKQVADFPNVIYILAMDREVVTRALEDVHGFDGNEYLEKIVQIPFEIPELSKEKLQHILFTKLDAIVNSCNIEMVLNKRYWSQVFRNCVDPYIHTLRDVNRVVNTFQFKFGLLAQESCVEDVIALTSIDVLEPKLYKWISENKESVCGSEMHSLYSRNMKPEEMRKKYLEEFKKLEINTELAIKCVATLFPVFAKDVNEHNYGCYYENNARGQMRVAQQERFDLYFGLNLEEVNVPRSLINKCIISYTEEELVAATEKINEDGQAIYFLDELQSLLDKIPYERLAMIAQVLYKKQAQLKGETMRAIFAISAVERASFCIEAILNRMNTPEERFNVIYNIVTHGDIFEIGSVCREINRIECAYGRCDSNEEDVKGQIISKEQLNKIEEAYVLKMHELIDDVPLTDSEDFHYILYLWENFDSKGASEYMHAYIKNMTNHLRYVCRMAGKWTGSNGSGWSFDSLLNDKYTTTEEVKKIIDEYDRKRMVNDFSEQELIKLASFVLNYKKDKIYRATLEMAVQLVIEWKND